MNLDAVDRFLIYSPCATASASLVGSLAMLVTLYRSRKGQKLTGSGRQVQSHSNSNTTSRTYDRLVTGIAVSDAILSIGLMLGPLPIPEESQFPGAHGTQATCIVQATLLQLGTASIPYSFMLMLYYVLVVRYNVKEQTISNRIEPILHFAPIAYHVTTAILGISWEVMNQAGSICWVAASPLGCTEDPELECERGGDWEVFFGDWLVVVPMLLWTGLLITTLAVLAFTVWQRLRQTERYVFHGSQRNALSSSRQAQQVMIQCLLYAFTFANFTIWSTVGNALYYAGREIKLWTVCLATFFFPLQGLFNFLIFIRPRYLRKRSLHASMGRWYALREAVWNPNNGRGNHSTESDHVPAHVGPGGSSVSPSGPPIVEREVIGEESEKSIQASVEDTPPCSSPDQSSVEEDT